MKKSCMSFEAFTDRARLQKSENHKYTQIYFLLVILGRDGISVASQVTAAQLWARSL